MDNLSSEKRGAEKFLRSSCIYNDALKNQIQRASKNTRFAL